jgi:tetratricopeptide (TPR) repeat protein
VLAVLALANREPEADPLAGLGGAETARDGIAADTAERTNSLQGAIRDDPESPSAYALLGDAYLQRARETADPAYYGRAEQAFGAALGLDPGEPTATIGQGTLALARHDFTEALALGQAAHRLEPDLARPYTVIADAQIELGRYDAAARTLDRLVSLKPTLAAYTRVSYFRELNGDLDGAVEAMRLAASAGGGSVEASAYVEGLLGKLEVDRGRYGAARQAFGRALALDPGYAPALAGLARLDAAEGRLDAAIRGLREVVARLPLPEYAIALGEAELAAGRAAAAERDLALANVQARLLARDGVNTDAELAVYEADHGSAARAVELGRRAWSAAPSVRSADALAWALRADGRTEAAARFSKRAMSLGSRDPYFLYHAGIIARDAGQDERARGLLATLVEQSPRFHPLMGPAAARALEGLR